MRREKQTLRYLIENYPYINMGWLLRVNRASTSRSHQVDPGYPEERQRRRRKKKVMMQKKHNK